MNWQATLSNNEIVTENVFPYEIVPGDKTPWLRLVDYLHANDLTIIGLSLVEGDRVINLPSDGSNPKLSAFANCTPLSYNCFRMLAKDLSPDSSDDYYSVIEAIYRGYALQMWVDEKTKECWPLVKQID